MGLIAEGTNINDLAGASVPVGNNEVKIFVSQPPDSTELAKVQQTLLSSGIILTAPIKYHASSGAIIVKFNQPAPVEGVGALPTLGLISGAFAATLLISVVIFAWTLSSALSGSGGLSDLWVLGGIVLLVILVKSKAVKGIGRGATKVTSDVFDAYKERKLFVKDTIRDEKSKATLDSAFLAAEEAQRRLRPASSAPGSLSGEEEEKEVFEMPGSGSRTSRSYDDEDLR